MFANLVGRTRSWWLCGFLFLVVAACGLPCAAQRTGTAPQAGRGAMQFRSIEEVVDRWSADQHVYVQGNIGVSSAQLAELEQWLSRNAPHWTVVLMENADNQAFTAADGRHYSGMDAVEYALGFGLSNRTAFGRLEHPVTHEADGAVFVLFLKQRKFSYFSSDAQDRRDLGETHWIGELDQEAFRAMRSGGRILDAVKNTVKLINGRLEKSIQAEKNAEARRQEERQREVAEAQGVLSDLERSVSNVEKAAYQFRQQHPQATGALAEPPLTQWRQTLTNASRDLNADSARAIQQNLGQMSVETARYLNAYATESSFPEHLARLAQRSTTLQASSSSALKGMATALDKYASDAKESLEAGKLDFSEQLARADEVMRKSDEALVREQRQQEFQRLREAWMRGTLIALIAGIGIIIGLVLLLLNWRRRAVLVKALHELAEREASVTRETEHVDKLFTRNHDLLGSRERIEERGYTGITRELALKALDYVDDLFIMSKETKRVLSEARSMVTPRDPLSHVINLFSGSRYRQAINHVTGTPLKFSRASGIPLIVRDLKLARQTAGQGAREQTSSPPKGELPEEVSLTFEEILDAFKRRGVEAAQALDMIETCLTTVQDKLSEAQQHLEAAIAQEKQLNEAAKADGYFAVPHYFESLVPAAQANLKQADEMSAFDAVGAVQGPLASLERQLSQAQQLGRHLLAARTELYPNLHQAADALKQLGYTSDWIGGELVAIGRRADELFETAAKQSVAGDIDQVAAALTGLRERAGQVVQLAQRIQDELAPSLVVLAGRIDQTRQAVAGRLKLAASAVLHETDRDPDDGLSRAKSN
ncbi:MAG: hypothetical protein ACTHK7_02820, partial [Aureliella sp.]